MTALFPIVHPAGLLAIFAILLTSLSNAAPQLVKDINPLTTASHSYAADFRELGDTVLFTAQDAIHGRELWKTDGTAAGTVLVKDIRPGSLGSGPGLLHFMGGAVYFSADDGVGGMELWRSDGTAAGTQMVKDIRAGIINSNPSSMAVVGNQLYFFAESGGTGYDLWKSDGTAAGTVLVKNIWSGFSGYPAYSLSNLTVVGTTLFFTGDDGFNGNELWKSDGSPEGTVLVKDIHLGSTFGPFGMTANSSNPGSLVAVGSTLYFRAEDGMNGYELWKSDGTEAGTVMVKDIQSGGSSSLSADMTPTRVGGNLFFAADDGIHGSRLWKSDGTSGGTVMVSNAASIQPWTMCAAGATLYFNAWDAINGSELWKSEGTEAGTILVKDIRPGDLGSNPYSLTYIAGTLYFTADNGIDGVELWKSDGTEAGTAQVKNIRDGSASSNPGSIAAIGGGVYFYADDGVNGSEFWKSDGTDVHTVLVKNIHQTNANSNPASLTGAGGGLFFSADNGTAGVELWTSDGTNAGTLLTRDIRPGAISSISGTPGFTAIGSQVYFTAVDGISGLEVWKSDGTTAGTTLLKDIRSGTLSSSPQNLAAAGSTLYFSANDNVNGAELWKSDGTDSGTTMVKNIRSGSTGSFPASLVNMNGTLYFTANDGVTSIELWKSDGTDATTVQVKDIRPGNIGSGVAAMTPVGSTLFFTANDGTNGNELWKSDGTDAGTVMVRDITPGGSGSNIFSLTGAGGILYFSVSQGLNYALWKTDGTTGGTVQLKEIQSGKFITDFTSVGNTLFFTVKDASQSYELWKSDGTAGGTVLVKDIRSGTGIPSIQNLKAFGNKLYFTADNGSTGSELWSSDGTGPGTTMVSDLIGDSAPALLTVAGDRLFFVATSETAGRELWSYIESPPSGEIHVEAADGSPLPSNLTSVNLGTIDRNAGAVVTTLTVRNTGDDPLSILDVSLNQIGYFYTITTSLPSSIPAGGSAVIGISYDAPVDCGFPMPGSHGAGLQITSNDADESIYSIWISAEPVQAKLGITVNGIPHTPFQSHALPRTATGVSSSLVVTIRNDGGFPLASTAPFGTGGDDAFVFNGPAEFTLGPYEQVEYTVNFSPTTAGPFSGYLYLSTNDPCASISNMLNFTGTGNAVPEASDSVATAIEDLGSQTGNVSLPVSDADNDFLLLEILDSPDHGNLSGLPISPATSIGPLTYVPVANFHGTDSFTYRIYDGYQYSRTATVTIDVFNVNDPPVADAQSLQTLEDTPLPITLTATDVDSDEFTFTVVSAPAHGTLDGAGANRIYTPHADYHGPDSFTFTASDGFQPVSQPATVSITVTPDDGTPEIQVRTPDDVPVANGGSVDLGNVERRDPPLLTTWTIRNTGNESLTGITASLDLISPLTPGTWEITSPPPASIAPGASGELVVSFDAAEDPAATGFSPSSAARLQITSNDADENPHTVYLSATAVKPEISVEINGSAAPFSYDFGRFILPRTESVTVTVRNIGSSILESTSPVAFGTWPGFTFTGPASFSLNPGTSAEYTATFAPAVAGLYFASFEFATNDDDESASMVSFSGRGNSPPVAHDTVHEGLEDVEWQVSFPSDLATDADGEYWQFELITPPVHGNIVQSGVTHTYVPAANWSGTDSFTFRVFDGLEYSGIATATLHIAPVNDPPVPIAQSITVVENSSVPVVLTATDVDDTELTFTILQPPANGILGGSGANRIYTPTPGYEGPDEFVFQADDGENVSSATVSIIVIPSVPEIELESSAGAPLASGAAVDLGDVERSAPPRITEFTVRNTGTAPLTGVSAVLSDPDKGYVITTQLPPIIEPGGSATLGVSFDQAPVANPGSERISLETEIRITSNDADEDPYTLQLTAVPVQPELRLAIDGNPTALPASHDFGKHINGSSSDVTITVKNEGSSPLTTTAPVSLTGAAYTLTGSPTFHLAPHAEAIFTVTFSPPNSTSHAGSLVFATNGFEPSVTIPLTGRGNNAPVASAVAVASIEDSPPPGTLIEFSATDADGDPLVFQIVEPTGHGELEHTDGATAGYMPEPNFHGTDTLTYRVSDGVEFSNTATVTIEVAPVNDQPVALAQSLETNENTPLPIVLSASDVDSPELTYQIVTQPLHGTLTPTLPNPTYTPAPNYFGPDRFVFRVSDGDGTDNPAGQATVTISVISDGIDPAELDVESPPGTPVLHESMMDLGMSPVGTPVFFNFTLKNTGTGPLTGIIPQSSGVHETDFVVTTPPVFPIEPGAQTDLTVRFIPGGTGLRKTDLLISTNDTDESPFTLHLQGIGNGPGLLDTAFAPDFQTAGGVAGMAEQPDGKVILGGYFPSLNGPDKPNLVRLDPAGGVDEAFVGTTNDTVSTVTVLADGKIVIGGFFSEVNGVARPFLARLHADGSLDESFAPVINGYINCVAVQADGKLLIGGSFTEVNGHARSSFARLETDGTLDPYFQPNPNGEVRCLLVLDDERIYAGGLFGYISGTSREYLARLYSDGSIDASFNPDISGGPVNCIAGQAESKVVIGGLFSTVSGQNRSHFARLLANGVADSSLGSSLGANNQILALAAQTDGKSLVSGPFWELKATWRNGIGRVNENGSLDTTFDPDTWEGTTSAILLGSGKVLLAGNFGTVGGLVQNAVARLVNDPTTESLTVTGPTEVQWLRGGSSPETTQVSFDVSEDDRNTWTPLGKGVRIPGGWRMTGGVLPVGGHVRARARIHGGIYGGSSALIESETAFGVAPAAEITVEGPAMAPLSDGGTFDFGTAPSVGGTVVTILIKNTGPAPLTGLQTSLEPPTGSDFSIITPPTAPLARGETTQLVVRFAPETAGSKSAMLHIQSNDEDEPSFDLTLTGQALAPGITSGLTSETVDLGEDHTLHVTATGSPPLAYQWYVGPPGNMDQPVGTDSSELFIGPVSATRSYWVKVSNSFGHVDSAAIISVNFPPTISAIEDQSTAEDSATPAIPFTIDDEETAADDLILNVSSNNPSLVPKPNILISGSGANRQMVITPTPNQFGEATIHLTVTDGRVFTTESFLLVVEPINDAPSIGNITDQALPINAIDSPIAFTVGDVDDGPSSLLPSATSSNTALVENEGISFEGSGANRILMITPVADQYGTTTIAVTVSDGELTATTDFVLTVFPPNYPPTLSDIADQNTNEDTASASIPFTIGDVETAAAALTLSASSDDPWLVAPGGIVFSGTGGDRQMVITPALNQHGTALITVTVSDGDLAASETFTLTVDPVNDAPSISYITNKSTSESTPPGSILFNIDDIDTDLENLTVTASSSNMELVANEDLEIFGAGAYRQLNIMPTALRNGSTLITVTVSDGAVATSRTFILTVVPVNDPPTISDIANQSTDEDTPSAQIALDVGDIDNPLTSLTLSASSDNPSLVAPGGIVFSGAGANRQMIITPALNQHGTASITVTVSDGSLTASDTFVLTVHPVNDAPSITNITDKATNEGTQTAAIPYTIGDVDTDLATLTVTATSGNATLVPNGNITISGTGANRQLVITPAALQNGSTVITVTVSDGALTTSDTFTLTVTPINDPPTISNIADQSTDEDTASAPIAFTVGDIDTALSSLALSASSSNPSLVAPGSIVFSGSGANRQLVVTPSVNQNGSSVITVTVSDGQFVATDTFTLTVHPVNDAPTITNITNKTTNEGASTAAIPFNIGDIDTDVASLTVSATSGNATLVPNGNITISGTGANRQLVIAPAALQNGSAVIAVTVSDGALTTSDTFTLTVTPVNDPPTISNIADQSTNEDTASAPAAFTIGDIDTALSSLTLSASSSNPSLVAPGSIFFSGSGANRSFVIAPALNQHGTALITVTVSDGSLTASDTFALTVHPVNDAPTVGAIANLSVDHNTATSPIALSIGDVDNDPGTLTLSGSSSNPTLLPPANIVFSGTGASRSLVMTPATDQLGTATVTVTVSDGSLSATRTFVLTVLMPKPVITSPATATGRRNDPFQYQIAATNEPASFAATGLPSGLTLVPSTGLITGTPTVQGTFQVSLSATNAGGTGTKALTLTIQPPPPVISSLGTATWRTGTPFTYAITASNSPTTYGASGLPSGLSINTSSGVITGSTSVLGTFSVTLAATNGGGTGTKSLSLTILPPAPATLELFTGSDKPFDLSWKSIEFIPDGTGDYQVQPAQSITALPHNFASHTVVFGDRWVDDEVLKFSLAGGKQLVFYGKMYRDLYINDNGLIGLGSGTDSYTENIQEFKGAPQVALFWDDLWAFKNVRFTQLSDRVVVTYDRIRERGVTNQNTAQAELFFDGHIRFSYGQVALRDALVGLSNGMSTADPRLADFDGNTPPSSGSMTLAGTAVDGYLSGSTIFLDVNFNGILDPAEPSTETNAIGDFSLAVDENVFDYDSNGTLGTTEGRLVAVGGQDIATGLKNPVPLTAPAESSIISPLTTLVQAIIEANPATSASAAEALVKAALGVPPTVSLLHDDPIAAAVAGDSAGISSLARSVNVMVFLSQASAFLSNGAPDAAASSTEATSALADLIRSGNPVDLSNPATISGLLSSAAANLPGAGPDLQGISGVASIISASNSLINQAAATGSAAERVTAIVRSQGVSQGAVVETLGKVGTGEIFIVNALMMFTPENLDLLAAQAPVGDITGTESRAGAFEFSTATFTVNEDGADSLPVTVVRRDGNQGDVTIIIQLSGGTAAPGVDYQSEPIVLNFGPGELTKSVNLPLLLLDDSILEETESVNLSLSLDPENQVSAIMGTTVNATLHLLDNDSPGVFTFTRSAYETKEDGTTFSPVIIQRSGGTAGSVNLTLTPQEIPGGAVAGRDFNSSPFQVEFLPGQRTRLVTLPLIDHPTPLGSRPFQLILSIGTGSAAGASVGLPGITEVMILEDDLDPAPGFAQWIATTTVPSDLRQPLDRNGPMLLTNLMAYAMGLDPMAATPADLPRIASIDPPTGLVRFVYRRSKVSSVPLLIASATGMTNWETADIQSERQLENGGDWERVEASIPTNHSSSFFLRLEAHGTE